MSAADCPKCSGDGWYYVLDNLNVCDCGRLAAHKVMREMSNFTPGPWRLDGSLNDYGNQSPDAPVMGTIVGPYGTHVAVLPSDLDMEGLANARLIAASPDMFDAIRRLDDALESAVRGNFTDANGALSEARAVIAKAQP